MVKTLNISINADDEGAVLTINGASRYINPALYKTEMDLRILLRDEPDYVYNAVVGLLKEMAS
jgi:hypothetical protein